MSDEIPGPEVKGMIVVDDWVDESVLGAWHFATPEEVVTLVRRGVESGTIKGEEVEWCETHGCSKLADESHRGGDYVEEHCFHGEWVVGEKPASDTWNCHIVDRLSIPISALDKADKAD